MDQKYTYQNYSYIQSQYKKRNPATNYNVCTYLYYYFLHREKTGFLCFRTLKKEKRKQLEYWKKLCKIYTYIPEECELNLFYSAMQVLSNIKLQIYENCKNQLIANVLIKNAVQNYDNPEQDKLIEDFFNGYWINSVFAEISAKLDTWNFAFDYKITLTDEQTNILIAALPMFYPCTGVKVFSEEFKNIMQHSVNEFKNKY